MQKKQKSAAGSLFAIAGSDEGEVKRAASALAEELSPAAAGDFGRDVIDGCADNAEQAATRIHQTIEALLTLPFFGGEKFVWLRSINFLGDDLKGRAETVLQALEQLQKILAAGLPDGVKFLLSAVEVDKRRSFYKALGKLANLQVFDKVDASRSGWEDEAAGVIERRAKDRGLRLSGEALELFTLLTGGETRQIENELEKIDLYLGAGRRDVRRGRCPCAGAAFARRRDLRIGQCPRTTRCAARTRTRGSITQTTRKCGRHPARRHRADCADFTHRKRPDAAAQTACAAGAFSFHGDSESTARKLLAAFAAKKRWHREQLRARACGDACASFFSRKTSGSA